MAQKKITDFTLRSDFDETCNVLSHDSTQTWRNTGQQILNFMLKKFFTRLSKTHADDTYSLAVGVSHVDWNLASAAAGMVIPAAASGNAGQVCWIRKTDSTFNALTLSGGISTTLNTQGEAIKIHSNGTSWAIIQRVIPSVWTAFTPTGSWIANTTYTGMWRRIGDSIQVQARLALAGAPTSATLTVNIPSGLTIDTAKLLSTTAFEQPLPGSVCTPRDAGTRSYTGGVWYSSTTAVQPFWIQDNGSDVIQAQTITEAIPFTFGNTDTVVLSFMAPISGWNG